VIEESPKKYPRLNENPNAIYDKHLGRAVDWYETPVIPFGEYKGKLRVGQPELTHSQLCDEYNEGDYNVYDRGPNSGRLFLNYKLITFWQFPKNHKDLVEVIKKIEDAIVFAGMDITDILNDPEWRVEIPDPKYLKYPDKTYDINKEWVDEWHPKKDDNLFIPIKDYKGTVERRKEELEQQHIIPPMLKKNRSVPSGIGSKRYQSKKPLAWRQAMVPESIDFERGIEPKDAMKIGKKTQIEQWFDNLGINKSNYSINKDFRVTVNTSLELRREDITYFPMENLAVSGDLLLTGNSNLSKLPNNLEIAGSLDLELTGVINLPDNLIIDGYLDLAYTKITSLPDNLSVNGSLWIGFTNIKHLPKNLNVRADLVIHDLKLELPNDLQVGGEIYFEKHLQDMGIKFPQHLKNKIHYI